MPIKNEIGSRFGRLVVVAISPKRSNKQEHFWICACDCGGYHTARGSHLRSGNIQSCGCLYHKPPANHIDYTGKTVGMWTVSHKVGQSRSGSFRYLCTCKCGTTRIVDTAILTRGSGHCGCESTRGARSIQNLIYNNYKNGALSRGRAFELTPDEAYAIATQKCIYCESPPEIRLLSGGNNPPSRREYSANGIDRLDNDVGYVRGNVVPCCFPCNSAKRTMTLDGFLSWAHNLADSIKSSSVEERIRRYIKANSEGEV